MKKPGIAYPRLCNQCINTKHRHAAYRVGPYLICRCLWCPTLVVKT